MQHSPHLPWRRAALPPSLIVLLCVCAGPWSAGCGGSGDGPGAVQPDVVDGIGAACSSDEGCGALVGELGECRAAVCLDGVCELVTAGEGLACQPTDKCLSGGRCESGACVGGTERQCADDNPCTTERCDPAVGCVQETVQAACDDGDGCTVGDVCADGVCLAGAPKDCDDGDLCTTGDACVEGLCVSQPASTCDDSNACTTGDTCDPATGQCQGTPTAACACAVDGDCASFDDDDACNGVLICVEGTCVADPATVVTCAPPGDPCLIAACDPQTGQCGAAPVTDGTPCSDDNPCTSGDACLAGACAPSGPKACADGNPCTADACTPGGDCSFTFTDTCACTGAGCTPTGEPGDSLPLLFSGSNPVETVGLAMFDGYAVTCGGFGLDVYRIKTQPPGLTHTSAALPRCQNLEAGPLVDGSRIFWATHHGDAYLKVPSLTTLSLDLDSGEVTVVGATSFSSAESAEGMVYDAELDVLRVAFHQLGLARYTVGPAGKLTLTSAPGADPQTADAFANAWRLTRSGGFLYVADGQAGLKVVDRLTGAVVAAASTPGFAKDIEVVGTMALLATSTLGVHAFDISNPTSPVELALVFTDGSALQLAPLQGGTRLAVANTSDIAILDTSHPSALQVLAVDRGTKKSNQPRNLAVAASGDLVISGEWLGIGLLQWRDGFIGPELHLSRSSLRIGGVAPGEQRAEKLLVKNRGFAPLEISAVSVANPAIWSASPTTLTLAPGASAPLTVVFAPTATTPSADALTLTTNDPDEAKVVLSLVGNPPTAAQADVGSPLGSAFDFLDLDSPPEAQSIGNLHGNVLVLAYFATF